MADAEDDAERIRNRVHRMADTLQRHELLLAKHDQRLQSTEDDVKDLRGSMATSEQLRNAVSNIELKLTNLHDAINPIRRGVNAVVWLILSSIVLAVLALVLRGPQSP